MPSPDIIQWYGAAYPRALRGEGLSARSAEVLQLRILWRLCHDRRYLSTQQYAHVSQLIDEMGRMVGGWLRTL